MKHTMRLLCCTNGGLGLLPKAPGTWGSLKPLLGMLALGYFGAPPVLLISFLFSFLILSSFLTISLAPWYENYFGAKDPQQVVCDEAAGQSIALLGMAWLEPNNQISPNMWIGLALLGFILFRVFDIWKPGPINTIQKLPDGWGVLLDDVFAGIAAGVLVCTAAILLS